MVDQKEDILEEPEGCTGEEKIHSIAEEIPDEDPELLLQKELQEYKDKYFRALAEMENTRKRLYKEKIESQGFAVQNTLLDFLQPLDQFENALKHTEKASPEVKNWAIGFSMILEQFKQALLSNGVMSFDSVGTKFDPVLHEAVDTVESLEYEEGTVVEEFVRGYKMKDRIIRPAKVLVSKISNKSNH